MKNKIKTFAQRQKAEHIYNTFFDPYAENCLDFGLLDTLSFYGAITENEASKLEKRLEEVGENLLYQMTVFDKSQLDKNNALLKKNKRKR